MSKETEIARKPTGWKSRWVMQRNRILSSAKFQRWASRTPIFRGIARRRAEAQFNLIAGFIYTQIVYTLVQSGVIAFLKSNLHTVPEIAEHTGLSLDAADRLVRAGASLKLVESPEPTLWTLGEEGAALAANNGALAMIAHHDLLYRDLADPMALLGADRSDRTALSAFWSYGTKDGDASNGDQQTAQDYSRLMAATQPMVWEQICDGYDFAAHDMMLDIGGGSGGFVSAVSAIAPGLHCGLFDLPDVIMQAKTRFDDCATAGWLTFHSGSFKLDSLPTGYDLVTLIRILHDHDDDVVEDLLSKIHQALPVGGRLLIVEPMAETKGAAGMGDAYFGLYLWAMGSGRPRSLMEYSDRLKRAGFTETAEIKTPLPIIAKAIVATK